MCILHETHLKAPNDHQWSIRRGFSLCDDLTATWGSKSKWLLWVTIYFFMVPIHEWVYLMRPMQKKILDPQWQASRVTSYLKFIKLASLVIFVVKKGLFLFEFLRGWIFTNWSLKYIIVKLFAYRFLVIYSFSRYVMFLSNYALWIDSHFVRKYPSMSHRYINQQERDALLGAKDCYFSPYFKIQGPMELRCLMFVRCAFPIRIFF